MLLCHCLVIVWVRFVGGSLIFSQLSKKIHQPSPDVVIYTDASKTGWGAQIEQGINTCGIWSKSESTRHINYLELLAVDLALSSLFNNRSDIHIRVMSDNTTAVSYINAMEVGGGGASR